MTSDSAAETPSAKRSLPGSLASAAAAARLGRALPGLRLSAMFARRNRTWLALAILVIFLAALLILALASRDMMQAPLTNAIWLDRNWIYGDAGADALGELVERMTANGLGKAYVYVSSLGIDDRWTGGVDGETEFMTSRGHAADFVAAFRQQSEDIEILAWVEIWTQLDRPNGYRLDNTNLQENITDFTRLLVDQLGFDGVLLDVKPMFMGNDDLIHLINRVRSAVGVEKTIAVAVTADLTPDALDDQPLAEIAPGTMWSSFFKQRILVSADEVVLLMYQSYRQDVLDYVNWVAYHVKTYVDMLESNTKILVSIPNYGPASAAHNPEVESLANALAGVKEGLRQLDEAARPSLTGVAIYSDEPLEPADWALFRDEWLRR